MKKQNICQALGRRSLNAGSKLLFSLCAVLTLTQCSGLFGDGGLMAKILIPCPTRMVPFHFLPHRQIMCKAHLLASPMKNF